MSSPRIHEESKPALVRSFDQMREVWTAAAATEGGGHALVTGCREALEAVKDALTGYGCQR